MARSPYPTDPFLTGIAIAYKNDGYIADLIAPRQRVGKELFEWDEWNAADMYSVPDTFVHRLSAPNQVTFRANRRQDATEDYGLDSLVPNKDLDNADDPESLLGRITESTMELVLLHREQRLASVVFNSNSYLSTNRTTLSGTAQWNDPTSNPLDAINNALDIPLIRPNTLVIGRAAWTKLKQHPTIVEAVKGTGADAGNATQEQVAELFELDQVLVGQSRVNSANLGQTANYGYLWGKSAALITVNPLAQLTSGAAQVTTLMTAQFGDRVAGSIPEPNLGLDGGVKVRAGEKVKEVFVSNLGAYLFQNAVA